MQTRKKGEQEYDFALVLEGITELTPKVEDALFEAGCDDATLSFRCGRAYLTFTRSGPSLAEAILSAIRDVHKAGIASVLRVDSCDLVSQAEIARRINRTRQLVHQYIKGDRGPGSFPPPVYHLSDESPLWAWSDVAQWLGQNDLINKDAASEALHVSVINTVLAMDNRLFGMDNRLSRKILQTVGLRVTKSTD